MRTERFEWDDDKAAANWRVPGVTFDHAAKALNDVFQLGDIDDREDYGEERYNVLGMCDGTLLHVTCTERGPRIRIIPARRAERHERENYYRTNAT